MATDKNFVIKNGLTVGTTEIIDSSGNLVNTTGSISGTTITGSDRGTFEDLVLTGDADDDLTFSVSSGDWYIRNSQQNNGLVIYDGTAGVQFLYDNQSRLEVLTGGLNVVNGTLSIAGTEFANASRNVTAGTISSDAITITTASVPLSFVESGHTGSGQYWRMPLDGGKLRFDVSLTGGSSFTTYDNILQLNADGSIDIQQAQMFDTSGNINTSKTITSGAITSSGSSQVANLTVTGDLTVQGTTTTLETATLNVEDKNITLNYSTGDSSGSADGAGITIQDAVNSSTDATILWDTTNNEFEFSNSISLPFTNGTISFGGNTLGGPHGVIFNDDDGSSSFSMLYRTTPQTITFEIEGDSAKHTFERDGTYTNTGEIIVGSLLKMAGGSGNPISFMGTGSDANYRNFAYEDSDHHYVTNRHTNGDLVLMSNNGTGGGETARITLQGGSGTQDIDITNANLDLNSNNINNVGTISSGQINTTTTADATPAIIATNTGGLNATIQRWVGDAAGMELRNYSTSGEYVFVHNEQDNGFLIFNGTGGVDVLYNGSTVQSWDSGGGTDLVSGDFKVGGQTVIQSATNSLVNIGAVTASDLISTDSHVQSGDGSGGVALTINDGYGNANVTWNHIGGVPEQNGNAARIEVNTDSTSGATMNFEVLSNVTSGVAVSLDHIMSVNEAGLLINSGHIIYSNGTLELRASDVDFIVSDTTDAVTNFIWRDHSASKLYLGTSTAQVELRSSLNLQSGYSISINGSEVISSAGVYGGTLTSSQVTTALGYTPYQESTALSATTGVFSSEVNIDRELRLDARYDGGSGDNVLAFKDSAGNYSIRHNVNDGNGNYSVSLGYSGSGSGEYAVTNDGVSKILFSGHGQDGAVSLNAAQTGTAGNNISFSIGLLVDSADNTIRVGASGNGTGLDEQEGTKVFDASANAFATSYSVGSNQVIDSSSNLTNIGTISSGQINTTTGADGTPAIIATNTGGVGSTIQRWVGDSDSLEVKNIAAGDYKIANSQQDNAIYFYDGTGGVKIFYNGSAVQEWGSTGGTNLATGGFKVGGTEVISSSRNLTNIGTISSSNIVVTTSSVGEVGLEIRRSASTGRAQLTIADENGGDLWRIGATGPGSTDFAFFDGGVNVLLLASSTNDATFAADVISNGLTIGDWGVGSNTGQGRIGKASDRTAGTITNQIGGGSSAYWEIVDYAWSTVVAQCNNSGDFTAYRDFNTNTGGYEVNNTKVIDSSRQLTNIAKILGNSSSGGTTTFNVGRGDVYFENNTYSNADGAGVTLRTSSNPASGSIFDVRSSGQACRFFVGQNITTAGDNPFYVGDISTGGESTASNYEILLNTNGDITAEGNITAYGTVSDIRQKENIEEIDKPIERLEKIKGITFNYKKKSEDERLMGVIAQDLLKDDILKLAVYEQEDFKAEDDDPLKHTYGVRYEHLTAILIEAVKEQQKQIEELKEEVSSLRSKN